MREEAGLTADAHGELSEPRSAGAGAAGPRVAVFADGCFLPARDGISALRLNMVRRLAQAGIPVVLVHCYRGWTDIDLFRTEPYPTLLLSPQAFYDTGGAAAQALSAFQPNIVQADYLSVLAGPALVASQRHGPALVAEMPYIPSRFFRDQGLQDRELHEVNRLLGIVARVADAVVCWGANDKAALQDELRTSPSRLYAIQPPFDARSAAVEYDGSRSAVFLGNLYFHQNVTALRYICRSVLPAIHASDPEVTLTVVGDCPTGLFSPDEARQLRVLGYRDDLTEVWSGAVAALAPMSFLNGGVHTKVLTALAAGVPVLGSESATRGLPAIDGLFVCGSPIQYRDVLLRLLRDRAFRIGVGRSALHGIREHFDSLRSVDSLRRMYLEVLGRGRTRKDAPVSQVAEVPVELRETFRNRRFDGIVPPVTGDSWFTWVQSATSSGPPRR
jgi:hypothetical protein